MDDLSKLASITYTLIDFFPDNDPLKNHAREKVLAILDSEDLSKRLSNIQSLKYYLGVAAHQGWLGCMSYLILKKEYQKIKITLSHRNNDADKRNSQISGQQFINKDLKNKPAHYLNKSLSRQEKILKILSNKNNAQVSDIVKEIPNITKRTVRRDLDYLLKKGTIVRIGEWNNVFYRISDGTKALS